MMMDWVTLGGLMPVSAGTPDITDGTDVVSRRRQVMAAREPLRSDAEDADTQPPTTPNDALPARLATGWGGRSPPPASPT